MRRVSVKFVPCLLTEDQQFQRLATSSDLFQSESEDLEFMKLIITGDTILGQSSSRHNRKYPDLLGQRKHGRCDQRSKSCRLCFLMQMELFIMSTLPRTRQ
ncbi:hypothetical protein TNCV_3051921 [Trichonephila clavipes]|nr:hypothetical protein TNCV_3051921 [Trichonephila clavipes]